MIDTRLVDGRGGIYKARVDSEGEVSVVVHPHPPVGEVVLVQPFRQYFTDDGRSTGSSDLRVNGATNSVDFYISALRDYDIYIKSISIVIGDGGTPALNKYGELTQLTNGVQWVLFDQELGEYELHDGIKTNLEFIRIGVDTGAF